MQFKAVILLYVTLGSIGDLYLAYMSESLTQSFIKEYQFPDFLKF